MRRISAALLVGLALTGAPTREAAAGPGTKVPDAPYEPAFRSRVRAAIQKGVAYLRTGQLRSIGFLSGDLEFEESAAVLWTLRRAGLASDAPVFATLLKSLAKGEPKDLEATCLLVLGMSAQPLPDGDPFALPDPAKPPSAPSLSKEETTRLEAVVKKLLARQVQVGLGKGIGKEFDASGGWAFTFDSRVEGLLADLPSTYLALLSLESAARCGVKVPAKVHLAALGLLLRWQAPKGAATTLRMNQVRADGRWEWTERAQARGFGWAGSMSDEPTGYETAAGAVGLVLCQDALQKDKAFTSALKKGARDGVRDAAAWIQQNYDITKNPVLGAKRERDVAGPLYHHHWLQALARLAIHSQTRFVGSHDWYQEGAEELLRTQKPDGSWEAIWWSNCYALLFLMRASLTSTAPVFTVGDGDTGK